MLVVVRANVCECLYQFDMCVHFLFDGEFLVSVQNAEAFSGHFGGS